MGLSQPLPGPAQIGRTGGTQLLGLNSRPHGVRGIHGYLTPEAAGITIGPITVDLAEIVNSSSGQQTEVLIPSGFNYLILKLHAFHDRKDRTDEQSAEGRHHAFDIFRIVTDFRREDWDMATEQARRDGDEKYLREAARSQRDYFGGETSDGVLRLREHSVYRRRNDVFDQYISDFVGDLDDLFENVSPA